MERVSSDVINMLAPSSCGSTVTLKPPNAEPEKTLLFSLASALQCHSWGNQGPQEGGSLVRAAWLHPTGQAETEWGAHTPWLALLLLPLVPNRVKPCPPAFATSRNPPFGPGGLTRLVLVLPLPASCEQLCGARGGLKVQRT